jgi:NAD(P)-dependent dehydrogenase (short-subunit alcohol dehydrogenase family)
MRFDGKVAVVTGAARGLGRASAERLAEEGASVVAVDIDGDAVEAVAASLPTASASVRADISLESDVDAYMAAAVERFGVIDHYHLNAGVFGVFDALPDLRIEDFDAVIATNVRGQFLGLRAAFRQFRAQRRVGNIVLTGSIAGLTGAADLLPYTTSKHAVHGLVHAAAVYGGPLGIRVNAVAPGIVPTDLFASAASVRGGKNDMATRASTTPLRRAGTAGEIAAVAAFLLSDDSTYMTGQIVSADGGATVVNTVRPAGGAGAWDAPGLDAATYADTWEWTTKK